MKYLSLLLCFTFCYFTSFGQGESCGNPIVINSLPYNNSTSSCGSNNNLPSCSGYNDGEGLLYRIDINQNAEIKDAREYTDSLNIKTPSIEQKVVYLSGGNQQKVSLAKWLYVRPDLMILDEPTRGIDVGAKFEIFTIMNKLVEDGMSIIMISSELPEILSMTDRIYVLSEGRLTGEVETDKADQESIMRLATS